MARRAKPWPRSTRCTSVACTTRSRSLQRRGDLEPWVDTAILAERMLSNFFGAASEWASGVLSDAALPLAASYDANITLAGVATVDARLLFQKRARRAQKGKIASERARARGGSRKRA